MLDDFHMPPRAVSDIRREHFARLVNVCPGEKPADRINAFAEKSEMNPDYIRQLMNGKEKSGGRDIGHRVARKLEGKLGLEPNSMDHDPIVGGAKAPAKSGDQFSGISRDAFVFALQSLFSSTAIARPREAEELAASMREEAPEQLLRDPMIRHILAILDAAAAPPVIVRRK